LTETAFYGPSSGELYFEIPDGGDQKKRKQTICVNLNTAFKPMTQGLGFCLRGWMRRLVFQVFSRHFEITPRLVFWWVLILTLCVRLWIASSFPITGDEAYYIQWGRNLALGYYDQTPMIGWWTWAQQQVSTNLLWLRLPVVLLSAYVAIVGVKILSRILPSGPTPHSLAYAAMTLYLLHPVHVLPVFVAMDVPLIFFGTLALERFSRSERTRAQDMWVGVWLGLAFLSKYFAVLMGIAFAVALVLGRKNLKALASIGWIVLSAAPFVLLNVYWNSQNCWINYVFNLGTRFGGSGQLDLRKTFEYLGFQVYLISPFLVFFLVARLGSVRKAMRTEAGLKWACLFGAPFVLFLFSSLSQGQSLHYMLLFTFGVFLFSALVLSVRDFKWASGMMGVFLFLHLGAYAYVLTREDDFWKDKGIYSHYVLFRYHDELARALSPLLHDQDALATDGYTQASVLGFALRRPVSIWGVGSKYGRLDDWSTDWRSLEQKSLAVVMRGRPNVTEFEKFFNKLSVSEVRVRDIVFYVLRGEGFKAIQYRESVLPEILQRFYPPFLGHRGFACPLR
jgi:hypothetical protein